MTEQEYWLKRLDHTLTHTQTASQLIYLVDGAVVALVYFVIQAFGAARNVVVFASVPIFVLVGLNVMHALLIRRQRWWYRNIDDKLLSLLGVGQVPHVEDKWLWWNNKRRWWNSTHKIYARMHLFVAVGLAVVFFLMLAYGLFGWFPDLPSGARAGDWVLWSKTPARILGPSSQDIWDIEKAFPNYEACVKGKDGILKKLKRQTDIKVHGDVVFFYENGKLYSEEEFFCLPVTLDPRGKDHNGR